MTTIMQWMARIVGIGAVIAIVVAGFMMVTSNGDSGSQTTARNALMYAIVGLVVAAVAQLVVSFVLRKL
jgi:multisubunit Na+/H+ antiporter MnhB subunit